MSENTGAAPLDDGGPAFPMSTIDGYSQDGMSLRDYFAGRAMHACVADPSWRVEQTDSTARLAYKIADAMLAARKA